MGLLTFLAAATLFLFGQSTPEMASAQTLSSPIALTSYTYGTPVYLYNPASQSVLTPVEYTNDLTTIPWQSSNNTAQWSITLDDGGPAVLISAVSSDAAGCPGATAQLNAAKNSPVTTLCTPNTSLYVNFLLITTRPNTFVIVPDNNAAACITLSDENPVTPPTACSRLAAATQWQLVDITA
jgi:hypothetical protein